MHNSRSVISDFAALSGKLKLTIFLLLNILFIYLELERCLRILVFDTYVLSVGPGQAR